MLSQEMTDFYKSQGGYKSYREKITKQPPKTEYEKLLRHRKLDGMKNQQKGLMDIFRKDNNEY